MIRIHRRAALRRAADSVRFGTYCCEPLEQRMLLTATGDPVIVLTEPFDLSTWPLTVNESSVMPWLWKNAAEYQWDLSDGNWNTTDGDLNGYEDDAYGWNFNTTSPAIVLEEEGHGANRLREQIKGDIPHLQ